MFRDGDDKSGFLVMIIGDFTKLGGAYGHMPESCSKEEIMAALEGNSERSLKNIRLLSSAPLWMNGQFSEVE